MSRIQHLQHVMSTHNQQKGMYKQNPLLKRFLTFLTRLTAGGHETSHFTSVRRMKR